MTALAADALKAALVALETHTSPALSPDGATVAYLRTTEDGDEVWLTDGRRLAVHDGRRVRDLRWTGDGRAVVYRHADIGREIWALSVLDATTGAAVLVDSASVVEFWVRGGEIVYSAREPGARLAELYRLDGTPQRLADPNPGYHRMLVDRDLRLRGGLRLGSESATLTVLGAVETEVEIPSTALADLAIVGFSADNRTLYLLSSAGSETRCLVAIDTATGAKATLFKDSELDVASFPIGPPGVWCDPRTGHPDLVSVFGHKLEVAALTDEMAVAHRALSEAIPGDPVVLDRSADDTVWLTVVVRDDGPLEYHRYERTTRSAHQLFVNRPDLTPFRLPRLEPISYETSDRWRIDGYRLAPTGARGPAPTVVMVHGGPASRDLWRFHAEAQYLAACGYASLHLNYRGSTGRGRAFRLAGHGEWGGRMQVDLYDGVAHGVRSGLVDPAAVCFYGASYGGYAALLAATSRPELVRCAVAISPQCDLVGLATKPAAFWGPITAALRRQVLGDATREEAERLLRDRSPTHLLSAACPPLLIAHGVRDPRIPVAEVDAFVEKARAMGVQVTYLRFDDEGHHVQSNRNRAFLFSEIERFLERHVPAH